MLILTEQGETMSPDQLTHLTYASAAVPGIQTSDLRSILEISQNNNSRRSITGMLLYTAGSFFQVLEGDDAALQGVFAAIVADSRHTNVTKIIHEPITRRVFGDWTMGFAEVDTAAMATIEGLNDFFQQGLSLTSLEPGRAQKLLSAFGQGRWRARLLGRIQ